VNRSKRCERWDRNSVPKNLPRGSAGGGGGKKRVLVRERRKVQGGPCWGKKV